MYINIPLIYWADVKLLELIVLIINTKCEIISRLMRFPNCSLRASQVCNLSLYISCSLSLSSPSVINCRTKNWNCFNLRLLIGKRKDQKNATINQLAQWEGILGAWAALPIGHWQALNRSQAGRQVCWQRGRGGRGSKAVKFSGSETSLKLEWGETQTRLCQPDKWQQ